MSKMMKAKGKLKKNIGRFTRMHEPCKETTDAESSDLSQLRKPIDTNLCSLKQVAQLFEKGSDEVQAILSYECDVVYECRICRSLFRSLANFISHKRVYCPEKYNVTLNRSSMDPAIQICNKATFVHGDACTELEYKENCANDRMLRSRNTRKDPKKDLTSVVDMLKKKQNEDCQYEHLASDSTCPLRISSDNEQVLLEVIDSNQAAYQTLLHPEVSVSADSDLMKTQTLELKNMLSRDTAVLGPEGQLLEVKNISRNNDQCGRNEEDTESNLNSSHRTDLTCSVCNATFATKKTLTFHVKSKHMAHQMNYPCPCCTSIFTNRASVHRHLVKVHRKSNEQMRKLRLQIQAMKMTNEDNGKAKVNEALNQTDSIEESQNLIIAQGWMENLELDTELQRCGACGRRFDRRAALVSHSLICPKRAAGARNETTGRHKRASKNPPQRVTENISSRLTEKPVEDRPTDVCSMERSSSPKIEIDDWRMAERRPSISISRVSLDTPETSIRVEDVSSLSKDVWDKIGTDQTSTDSGSSSENKKSPTTSQRSPELKKTTVKTAPDVPEVIYTSIDNARPLTLSVLGTEKKLGIQYRGIRLPTVTLEKINVTRSQVDTASLEPNILVNVPSERPVHIDKKFSSLADARKLQCLPCNRKFTSLINLRRHVAVHQRRNRYRCKLCDFKAFLKCECIAHCNKKHNARNNRAVLASLVIEVPQISDSNENEKPAKMNATEARDELEVIDVTVASTSASKHVDSSTEKKSVDDAVVTESNPLLIDYTLSTVGRAGLSVEKPKKGKPSKPKRGKKRRVRKKKQVKRPKHVSPPTLAGEFSECDEVSDIVNSKESIDERSPSRTSELARLRAPSRMEHDPELRKMVMEVIFGTTEKSIAETIDKENDNATGTDIDIVCERILDNGEIQRITEMATANNSEPEAIDLIEKTNDSIRIDPVNDPNSNFRYGLKAVAFPKDVVFLRSPIVTETKTLTGRSLVQLQTRDDRCDSKLTGGRLIIYKDKSVDGNLTEIKQADVVMCAEK